LELEFELLSLDEELEEDPWMYRPCLLSDLLSLLVLSADSEEELEEELEDDESVFHDPSKDPLPRLPATAKTKVLV